MKKTLLIVTILILGVFPAAHAAMFSNGSFEIGPDPGGFIEQGTGSTAIDSWVVSSGTIDYIGSTWAASSGSRSIDLNGLVPGTISQTFDTVLGQNYTILFDLAGNPDGGPTVKTMKVEADAHSQDFTFDTTGNSLSNMGWMEVSFDFVASGSETTLSFSSLDSGGYGPAIDNVRVVPIPAAAWLLGSALIGLVGYRRRCRS